MKPYLREFVCCLMVAAFLSFHPPLQAKDQKDAGKIMASVDGVAITETQVLKESADDLDSLELQILRSEATHKRDRHEILEQSLDRLVEEMLLKSEADKRGIPETGLIEKEVTELIQEPTKEQVDAFYQENKENINKPKDQVEEKIRLYLKKQQESNIREAFLKKLEKEHHVTRSFDPIRFDVDRPGCPSKGSSAAPVVLVLFSDFQCPYCREYSRTIEDVLKKYGDRVRLVFRQFPLTRIHANAMRAAEASLCAAAQKHFWEMHDQLFQNQSDLTEETIQGLAKDLNLDKDAFSACLKSAGIRAKIQEDIRAAAKSGADGTPTLYVNGRYLGGARSFEEIAAIIDEELAP
jgi:predicted DsbA family dithiol-disulfide isomerase